MVHQIAVRCLDSDMTDHENVARVVSASREIVAPAGRIFELIANPTDQPLWDGSDNLVDAPDGQRVHAIGETFTMTTTKGNIRENHVVEFEEGRRIAWKPAEPDQEPLGHLWRWELEPLDPSRTHVVHTCDWTQLTDEKRFPRARATTSEILLASNRAACRAHRAPIADPLSAVGSGNCGRSVSHNPSDRHPGSPSGRVR